MSAGADIIQLVLASGAVVTTAIAAVRVLLSTRKKRQVIKVQIGGEEWTVDPATTSRSQIDELLRRLTAAIEPEVPESRPDPTVVLRLPRFDKTVMRAASSPSRQRPQRVIADGGLRYVLIDSGDDRLEILVESADDSTNAALLPVTVITPDGATSYLLLFRQDPSGAWVADLEVPGFRTWADVTIHEMREVASLSGADAEVVARSVQATSDSSVPAWQEVARSRTDGDPVRAAIASVIVL
jgi:hypothetical protein